MDEDYLHAGEESSELLRGHDVFADRPKKQVLPKVLRSEVLWAV